MAKMGRIPKEINFETLDKLLHLQCTQRECCAFFNVTDDTLNNRIKQEFGITYSEYSREKMKNGLISLRRQMWHNALDKNNTTMQIWLSKQHLGFTEKTITFNEQTPRPTILKLLSGEQIHLTTTFEGERDATDQEHEQESPKQEH